MGVIVGCCCEFPTLRFYQDRSTGCIYCHSDRICCQISISLVDASSDNYIIYRISCQRSRSIEISAELNFYVQQTEGMSKSYVNCTICQILFWHKPRFLIYKEVRLVSTRHLLRTNRNWIFFYFNHCFRISS